MTARAHAYNNQYILESRLWEEVIILNPKTKREYP